MELPTINDLTNNDWSLTLISSLHSTIEFLKGEINVKNEIINKLLNRGNQCEHENLLKDDTSNCDDESFCSENLSNGQLQETCIDQNKNKRFDDRYVTSRTTQRLNRVNTNCDDIEITNEQDSNNTVKSVEIIGDSIINNINPRGISKEGNVKVKSIPGSTSDDMKDHIKLTVRRKPDAIIIHVGTNDIGNDIDTITNIQNIVAHIKKKSSHTKIIISSLLIRHGKRKIEEKIKILNNELKKFCEENLVDFLGHENIDVTCLGEGKVHQNKKGKAYLAKFFIKFINNIK